MIDRRLFSDWLDAGLRFANLTAKFSDAEAEHALRGDPADIEAWKDLRPWYGPERSYQILRREWVRLLQIVEKDAGRRRSARAYRILRRLCEEQSMSKFGESNFITASSDVSPLAFDDFGRPQLGFVHACRPEGLLAVVGAELIAPGAPFGVRKCANPDCGHFFSMPLMDRPRAHPRWYCPRPECRKSTARVKKLKEAKLRAKSRKRRDTR